MPIIRYRLCLFNIYKSEYTTKLVNKGFKSPFNKFKAPGKRGPRKIRRIHGSRAVRKLTEGSGIMNFRGNRRFLRLLRCWRSGPRRSDENYSRLGELRAYARPGSPGILNYYRRSATRSGENVARAITRDARRPGARLFMRLPRRVRSPEDRYDRGEACGLSRAAYEPGTERAAAFAF